MIIVLIIGDFNSLYHVQVKEIDAILFLFQFM